MGTIQKEITKFYLSFLTMEMYYTKKEFNEMKNALMKQIKSEQKKNEVLRAKIKALTTNSDVTE